MHILLVLFIWRTLIQCSGMLKVIYYYGFNLHFSDDYWFDLGHIGSDHELLIAKFRLKLKKVGKTTRPFRYDLNQIPYDYTVEVRNRFKGLGLIECLKNYGWRFVTLYRRQGSRRSPRKRMQKGKTIVWGGLTNNWEKERSKRQGRKGKNVPI